uniref:Cytochrome P450 709B2-like n=1 Tax=Ananas comosus var. bracteatus TaxID=296719 RepID=A0A6V7QAV6_ANACO|nr:unnamed protein product [Ananas comosus var. bracteatus]
MGYLIGVILGTLLVVLITRLWSFLVYVIWRPYAITKKFREQGIMGPAYKLWSGSIKEIISIRRASEGVVLDINSHDITPRVLPHYTKWISLYGRTFLYWFGPQPRICVTDPEQTKQVLSNKFGFYIKPEPNPIIFALMGKGLVFSEGSDWARHRRVVNPAFAMDKLKMMTKTIAKCVQSMIEGWQIQDESQEKEIEFGRQFQELTADVISHTAFGSSYKEGKEVFLAQKELQKLALATFFNIHLPIFRYIPTSRNLHKWKLERKARNTLMRIIQSRFDSKESGYGNDLLGLMLEACTSGHYGGKKEDQRMNMDEIIDESKPRMAREAQEEVLRECGKEIPDADMLSKLRLVTMVLFEALRLYGPVVMMHRKADKDMNLGTLQIPKGTAVTLPLVIMHRDKEIWGADANEFNPFRFENGITKAAKHPNALLAFSIGPRACIGQNFAMLEAKIVLAMILQRFSFRVSPNYKHAPADLLTLQPKNGLPIILSPLNA